MTIRWTTVLAATTLLSALPVTAASAAPHPTELTSRTRCEFVRTPDEPAVRPVDAPRPKADDRGTVRVSVESDRGEIVLELDRAHAPCAVHNLVHLAEEGFYDETPCHRLTDYPDRLGVLQCGDPSGTGDGGPGYRFADELTGQETYPRGTVAMANAGPDTNGSQFFLVHSVARIKPNYTVLGRVTEGMAVLDAIAADGIEDGTEDGAPAEPVTIEKVTYQD